MYWYILIYKYIHIDVCIYILIKTNDGMNNCIHIYIYCWCFMHMYIYMYIYIYIHTCRENLPIAAGWISDAAGFRAVVGCGRILPYLLMRPGFELNASNNVHNRQ